MDSLAETRNSNSNENFQETNQKLASGAGLIMDVIVQSVMDDLLRAMNDNNEGENPMVLAEDLGHEIDWGVELAFSLLMVSTMITALVVGTGSCINPYFLGFIAFCGFLLPVFITLTLYLLAIGGVLAVVVPMIPAVVYFMAVIGWLISVVETMVAAPIVAIGVLHPEGHPVWGKAEPAIMLLANMFLRPSLIVIGMAAGVVISFISLQVINFGFENIMNQVLDDKNPTAMELVVFLSTYVGLVVAAVNKSFSLVNQLPEACMRWIQGGEATRFGDISADIGKVQEQIGKGEKTAEGVGQEMHSGGEKKAAAVGDAAKGIMKDLNKGGDAGDGNMGGS